MPKLPDFSKIAEKLDLQGIMQNVKSVISPGSVIPEHLEGDPVVAKLALIHAAMQTVKQLHDQQEQEITKINTIIASIYKDIEGKQGLGVTSKKPKAATPKTEAPSTTDKEK